MQKQKSQHHHVFLHHSHPDASQPATASNMMLFSSRLVFIRLEVALLCTIYSVAEKTQAAPAHLVVLEHFHRRPRPVEPSTALRLIPQQSLINVMASNAEGMFLKGVSHNDAT